MSAKPKKQARPVAYIRSSDGAEMIELAPHVFVARWFVEGSRALREKPAEHGTGGVTT